VTIHKQHLLAQDGVLANLKSSTQRRYACGFKFAAALAWIKICNF
jgi:hypothetical protein